MSEIVRDLSVGAALLSDPASIRWIGVTCSARVHAVISGGDAVLVAPADAPLPDGVAVERFGGDDRGPAADAVGRALARTELRPSDAVAVEPMALPVALSAGLGERTCRDAGRQLAAARARKDEDELELIERAAALASIGQDAAHGAVRAGVSELELWAVAQAAMQDMRGGRVEAGVDLMVGDRTALIGCPPGPHVAGSGDPVLFDLAPRRDGYWADSCATFSCDAPSAALERRHDAVRTALDLGLRTSRPGVPTRAVDQAIRAVLARAGLDCPHHTGHGVGTAPQEQPWLTPDDDAVLEEGMVIALEPGAYSDRVGVRLEHLAVVEAGGARPLTAHSLDLT